MIENEIKTQDQVIVKEQGKTTSPIGKSEQKDETKKTNGFVAWLKDADTVDENNGKVDKKTAATSFAKGLIEIVKTVYTKPLASAITIAVGAALTILAGYSAVATVMCIAVAAGSAGIAYAGYNLAKPTTSNNTKQAYEVLGISTFVLAVGIYGLVF
ncbi:MAG: hypothetical protein K6A44_04685 [bacterium]|nr:hypothetical protein [bacterium]